MMNPKIEDLDSSEIPVFRERDQSVSTITNYNQRKLALLASLVLLNQNQLGHVHERGKSISVDHCWKEQNKLNILLSSEDSISG